MIAASVFSLAGVVAYVAPFRNPVERDLNQLLTVLCWVMAAVTAAGWLR